MAELTEREILAIIQAELQDSAGGSENDFIESNRQAALATYLGQPNGKEVEGRSAVISTDVADAIEWILPEIVKAFTQNNEVVTFDPCCNGDEDQAELESQYVYDILMKDNNGFLVIHQFVKDALLQKNGFIKVFYEKKSETLEEAYTGLTELEVDMVLSGADVTLKEQSEYVMDGIPFYDIKVTRECDDSKLCIISVPPEEFRVNRQHNSVDLKDARFTAHVMTIPAGDLVAQGYAKDLVDELPSAEGFGTDRDYRFYMQDESTSYGETRLDASLRLIDITECYMHIDIDKDGIAEFVKITVAGGDSATHLLDVEPISDNPFISSTAILMSHKLFGLSIYDRLKQIQEQKTTLWRNILDNMYFQNNQRTIVLEGQVNLDDVMMSRPGGIIRAKSRDAVVPYTVPALSSDAYRMMDYLDRVREGRSGVSPEGVIKDNMIGDRVGSQGLDRMLTQKEELVGLMIRVIAETGIKPLCYKIRSQVMKHQDLAREYRFRGQWIQVDPTKWRKRSNSTVRVGTGSGNRQQQTATLTQILMMQKEIMANPSQALVTEAEIYSAISDFAKVSGLPGVSKYFKDPRSPEGQQHKQTVDQNAAQQQQMLIEKEKMMLEAQMKVANAQERVVAVEAQNVQLKSQNDAMKNQIAFSKQEADMAIKSLQQQLDEAKVALDKDTKNEELAFKYHELERKIQIEMMKLSQPKETGNE